MRSFILSLAVIVMSLASAEAQTERETLVFLSPRGPFFIGASLRVDDHDFRDWLTSYLFEKLADRDGAVNAEQLQLMPAQLVTRLGFDSAERLAAEMLGEEDTLTKADFIEYMKPRLSTPFLIAEARQSAVQAINVLPKFDADGDGHLSEQELHSALDYQSQQDIDDDQTLSAAELLPFRDPLTGQAAVAPNPDNLPFLQIIRGEELRLAQQLVKYYSALDGTSKLTPEGTRLTPAQFGRFDADGDGRWNAEEAEAFLRNPHHHVRLAMQFSRRSRAVLKHEVQVDDPSVSVEEGRPGRLELKLDGLPISIRLDQYLSSGARFTRNFCGQRFALADKDRNKYLDATEFTAFVGQVAGSVGPLEFPVLDTNKDEMVTREELFRHLDRDTIAAQSRLEVTVSSDGRSMFLMLDTNSDRRLSLRELQEGFDRIAALDRDADRRVSRMEAASPSRYTLKIGLGRPQLFRNMGMDAPGMMATDAVIRSADSLSGPLWFRRMDRNRDGDVSRREFLGTLEQFRKLDSDGDGLLNATEAETADGASAKSDAKVGD